MDMVVILWCYGHSPILFFNTSLLFLSPFFSFSSPPLPFSFTVVMDTLVLLLENVSENVAIFRAGYYSYSYFILLSFLPLLLTHTNHRKLPSNSSCINASPTPCSASGLIFSLFFSFFSFFLFLLSFFSFSFFFFSFFPSNLYFSFAGNFIDEALDFC